MTLLIDGEIAPNNKYQYRYFFLGKQIAKESHSPSEVFTINVEGLEHGTKHIKFYVDEWFFLTFIEKVEAVSYFNITNRFNGVMELVQNPNYTVRENGYVSSQAETIHNIIIAEKDRKLYEQAAYIRVFWFVDCLYLGEYCKYRISL